MRNDDEVRVPLPLRVSTIALIAAGIGHLGGHALLVSDLAPGGSAVAARAALVSTGITIGGVHRTLLDAMTGFSWMLVVMPLGLGLLLHLTARSFAASGLPVPNAITFVAAVVCGASLVTAILYLPVIAIALFFVGFAGFTLTLIGPRLQSSPSSRSLL